MSECETAAQTQLGEIGRELEAIRFRLLGVHASLPAAPAELVHHLEMEEEMAASTHIRVVIETLLEDKSSLPSAISGMSRPFRRDCSGSATSPNASPNG